MTPAEWRPYLPFLRASHWSALPFDSPDDIRSKLTWAGRFRDVGRTLNFYSSEDEVVANGNGEHLRSYLSRKFAWYKQEYEKGSYVVSSTPEAGWAFGEHYLTNDVIGHMRGEPVYGLRRYTAVEAAQIPSAALISRPFFKGFSQPEVLGPGGDAFLRANADYCRRVLSHGIPAESFATGANPVPLWDGGGNNVNMARALREKGIAGKNQKWVHSYFIQRSLFETGRLFSRIAADVGVVSEKKEDE